MLHDSLASRWTATLFYFPHPFKRFATSMALYTASFLLCAFLLVQATRALVILPVCSPYDMARLCLDTSTSTSPGHALANTYTETQNLLFDSYGYTSLFGRTNPVWRSIQGNNRNRGVSNCCNVRAVYRLFRMIAIAIPASFWFIWILFNYFLPVDTRTVRYLPFHGSS